MNITAANDGESPVASGCNVLDNACKKLNGEPFFFSFFFLFFFSFSVLCVSVMKNGEVQPEEILTRLKAAEDAAGVKKRGYGLSRR